MSGDFGGVEGQEGVGGVPQGEAPLDSQGQPQVVDPSTGDWMPRARFDQIYGKMKDFEAKYNQYSGLGDVADIKAKLQKLDQWEKTVAEHQKQANMSPDDKAVMEHRLKLQKELYQVMPSLKLLDKIEELEQRLQDMHGKTVETQATTTLKEMSSKLSDVLKEHKIDLKHQNRIEDYLASQMTTEQKKALLSGDFSVVKTIFDNEIKDGLLASFKPKTSVPAPPVRNTAGGTPPGRTEGPKTMKDADDAAWSRLSNRE